MQWRSDTLCIAFYVGYPALFIIYFTTYMEILIIAAQLILSLSILIVLHEFGHFLPARAFNIKVEKFYLFFDPYFALFKKKIGDTEWGIGWLPLGGYVKIAGMIDESMDKEQMQQPIQDWEFRAKPAWQRLIVMLGGVTVNFVLGFLIFALVLFAYGESFLPTQNAIYGIEADSVAQSFGFRTGDQVVSLDNEPIENFSDIKKTIFLQESKTAQVIRDGQTVSFDIPADATGQLASYKGAFVLPRVPFEVEQIIEGSPADSVGIQQDDKIIALDSTAITYFDEFTAAIKGKASTPVSVTVLRGTDTLSFMLTTTPDATIGAERYSDLGHYFTIDTINYSLAQSFPAGFKASVGFLGMQINAFGQMFRGKVKASESLGGFGTIASMFGTTWNWERFWRMTAILSLILAFMNLLPIPALDGGHVVFLLYEMVTGRAPSDQFLERATMVGFIIIVGLVLYANGLDILRWFNAR